MRPALAALGLRAHEQVGPTAQLSSGGGLLPTPSTNTWLTLEATKYVSAVKGGISHSTTRKQKPSTVSQPQPWKGRGMKWTCPFWVCVKVGGHRTRLWAPENTQKAWVQGSQRETKRFANFFGEVHTPQKLHAFAEASQVTSWSHNGCNRRLDTQIPPVPRSMLPMVSKASFRYVHGFKMYNPQISPTKLLSRFGSVKLHIFKITGCLILPKPPS